MNTEEKLKEMILSKYRSVLEFTEAIDMPYGTIASIFKRGINNSSVTNIIKICHALGISADELANGRIIPVDVTYKNEYLLTEMYDILKHYRMNIEGYEQCTVDGMPMTIEDAETLLDSMEIALGIIKRRKLKDETQKPSKQTP